MTSIRLIAINDEYDTSPGLALAGTHHGEDGFFADRTGGMIAHDIVEHQNGAGAIGTVFDELQALGGIWLCHGEWGDFTNSRHGHTAHSNLSSAVARMFEDWACESNPRIPRTYSDYRTDEDFAEIINLARAGIIAENYNRNGDTPEEAESMESYLSDAMSLMRIGYRKALRRHGSTDVANSLYHAIEDALKPIASCLDYVGQEFVLTYTRDKVVVREVRNPEY